MSGREVSAAVCGSGAARAARQAGGRRWEADHGSGPRARGLAESMSGAEPDARRRPWASGSAREVGRWSRIRPGFVFQDESVRIGGTVRLVDALRPGVVTAKGGPGCQITAPDVGAAADCKKNLGDWGVICRRFCDTRPLL